MCFMFSVTTPMGIVLGMILFSVTGYDDSSPKALIMEGLLGSFSSGILIYMGLVDLIAVDFFHNKMMTSNLWLKKASYIALILGSTSMSILALWAWALKFCNFFFSKHRKSHMGPMINNIHFKTTGSMLESWEQTYKGK